MKNILFVDDAFENEIPRYEFTGLPSKVSNFNNIQVYFRTTLPAIHEVEEYGSLTYTVPDFDRYDIVFVHTSHDGPIAGRKAIDDLVDRYKSKLYRFAGGIIPDRNGLRRDQVYANFRAFTKFINNYDQIDLQILRDGPSDYLDKKYQELLNEIIDFDNWKESLTGNWWFYLQDYFKLSDTAVQDLRRIFHELEYFSEFESKLEEVRYQANRRLFL